MGRRFLARVSQTCTSPGAQNGYWLNFGFDWVHLANDNFSQMLTGAAPRLYHGAVVPVWIGQKPAGNDPVGAYTRIDGCDPTAILTVEAA